MRAAFESALRLGALRGCRLIDAIRYRLGRSRELESLERVLSTISDEDALLSLGDVVGYGPNPNECVAALGRRCRHAVLGNHDLAAVENFGVESFNHAARTAIGWTQEMLDETSRAWLNSLPYELRLPEFLARARCPRELLRIHPRQGCGALGRSTEPMRASSSSDIRTLPNTGYATPTETSGTNTCSREAS